MNPPDYHPIDMSESQTWLRSGKSTSTGGLFALIMLEIMILLSLVLPQTTASLNDAKCNSGSWRQLSKTEIQSSKQVSAARNSLVVDNNSANLANEIKTKNEIWLKESCPAQIVQHSCYAHGNVERAMAAEYREWKPSESTAAQCKDFSTKGFLAFLKGKTLHMVGDSVMMQTWVSLLCEMHALEESSLKIDFYQHTTATGGSIFNDRSCPWKEKHCHIHGGTLTFAKSGTSLVYHSVNRADGFEYDNSEKNIYIINNGLHFHDQEKYKGMITGLSNNLGKYLNPQAKRASFYFLETYPQHFSAPNGDFDLQQPPGMSNRSGISCFPKLNFDQNWRNKIAHSYLDSRIPIIPIESQLNSQWDAHVSNSKLVPYHKPDCTHWCYPAAAFTYVQRAIYNYIVN